MNELPPRVARDAELFLIEAVRYAVDEDMKEVDLAVVPSNRLRARGTQYSTQRLAEIKLVAEEWQKRGFGKLNWNGRPLFKFSERAIEASNAAIARRNRKSVKQRVAGINWNAVNAVAAMIAAVAAVFAAVFSYLALAK